MIYEYRCPVCRHELEVEQSITDKPIEECPRCHTAALVRLASGGSGFLLQGNGWAKDGYVKK